MKRLKILLLLLTATLSAATQENTGYAKLGASLKLLLNDQNPTSPFLTEVNGKKNVAVLLELEPGVSETTLLKYGIQLRTRMGDIATADLPIGSIVQLASSGSIKRIELPLLLRRTDTLMRKFTGTDKVLAGDAPLDKAYTGSNTIIGIIDDGIDITHPDFYDSNGRLRVLSAWNMDYNQLPPAGFSYGNEWSRDSMEYYAGQYNAGNIRNYKMETLFGHSWHGTAVAGLASGKRGVATGSGLVSVALTATPNTLLRSDRLLDAIKYIYNFALNAGKKCIINISLGVLDGGPHDGKTLLEKAIDAFSVEKSNLLICSSAGNSGNDWKHWGGFPINKDSSYAFFRCAYEGTLYFCIPRQNSNNLSLSFTDSKPANIFQAHLFPDTIIGQTPFSRVSDLINASQPITYETRFSNNTLSSTITLSASHYNEEYDEVLALVKEYSSGNTNLEEHLYRFIWKGQGTLHAWFPFFNLQPHFIFNNNPFPSDSTFRMTDNEYSTVIPSHAFSSISTGAYNIRSCYVNGKKEAIQQYDRCRTTYFTSHGPTLDGRIKPDLIAPGENIMTSRKRFDDFFDHQFIIDTNTIAFGGTSASSPITAGIAALFWEHSPNLTKEEIIQQLKSSATFDSWSAAWGARPNNVAGWGKINAFKALTGIESEPSVACGFADTCIYTPPPQDPLDTANPPSDPVKIFPNPVSHALQLQYFSPVPVSIRFFDAMGRLLLTKELPASAIRTLLSLDFSRYAQGAYFLQWKSSQVNKTYKIIIAR